MSFDFGTLRGLPSPFYRVGVKALIYDAQHRLLLLENEDGELELPGGGWEHDESLEACVRRELEEEIHAAVRTISPIRFMYQGRSSRGWHTLRAVVEVELEPDAQIVPDDGLTGYRFVSEEEFRALPNSSSNKLAQDHADILWGDTKE